MTETQRQVRIISNGGAVIDAFVTLSQYRRIKNRAQFDITLDNGTHVNLRNLFAIEFVDPVTKQMLRDYDQKKEQPENTQPAEITSETGETPGNSDKDEEVQLCPSCMAKGKLPLRKFETKNGDFFQLQCQRCGYRTRRLSTKAAIEIAGDEDALKDVSPVEDSQEIINRTKNV